MPRKTEDPQQGGLKHSIGKKRRIRQTVKQYNLIWILPEGEQVAKGERRPNTHAHTHHLTEGTETNTPLTLKK